MGEGDQAVCLTASVRSVEPEDRGHLSTGSGQPAADVGEEVFQAARRIGVGEEPRRVGVVGVAGAARVGKHPGKVGRELGFGHLSLENVGPWFAEIEDGREGKGCRHELLASRVGGVE